MRSAATSSIAGSGQCHFARADMASRQDVWQETSERYLQVVCTSFGQTDLEVHSMDGLPIVGDASGSLIRGNEARCRFCSRTRSAKTPQPSFASARACRARSSANLTSAKRPGAALGRCMSHRTVPELRPFSLKSKLTCTVAPLLQTAVPVPSRTALATIWSCFSGRLIENGVTPSITPPGDSTAAAEGTDSNRSTAVFGGVAQAQSSSNAAIGTATGTVMSFSGRWRRGILAPLVRLLCWGSNEVSSSHREHRVKSQT